MCVILQNRNFIALCSALCILSVAAQAQLSEPQKGDISVQQLPQADIAMPLQNTNQDTVQFSWPVDNTIDEVAQLQPHKGISRGYWMQVSDTELSGGLSVVTSAPGSLVKISPLNSSATIDPIDMEIHDSKGLIYRGTEAMDLVANNRELELSNLPFPRGTSAFRLSPARGQGEFVLRTPKLNATGRQHYHVYVEEVNSDVVLELETGSDTYLYGQALEVSTLLKNTAGSLPVKTITGFLLSPDGLQYPIDFERKRSGGFSITMPFVEQPSHAPGLWEIQTAVEGTLDGLAVRRNVKTAFNYVLPHARLNGGYRLDKSQDKDILATLTVEVSAGGRYELRATLYGSDAQGERQAFMIANTASWLEAGKAELTLVFDHNILMQSNLLAPYEVRDIRLLDQSRMGLLHRQAYGFRFND